MNFLKMYKIKYPHFFSSFQWIPVGPFFCHLMSPQSDLTFEFTDIDHRILLTMTTENYKYVEFSNEKAKLEIYNQILPETIITTLQNSKTEIERLIDLRGELRILKSAIIYDAKNLAGDLLLSLGLKWDGMAAVVSRYPPINQKSLKQVVYRNTTE